MRLSERLGRIALSSASTFVLAALVFGVPALLVALHGRPDHPGTFAGLGHVITGGRVDPVAVVDLVAATAWGAWLVIAVAIVLEVVAWIRGRPTPRLGIAGPFQPIVRNLVATATLLLGTLGAPVRSGAITAANTAVVAPVPRAAPATQPAALVATPAPTPTPSCTVVPRDTLWGLAETHLKNPLRWREIFELNRGTLQPDGRRLEDPNLIIPGWTLHLPADAIALAPAPPVPAAAATAFAPLRPPPVSTPSTTATRTTAPSPSSTVPSTPSTASPPHHPAERHAGRDGHASPDQATDVAVSAVAAAGVIALLTVLRLARRRHRLAPRLTRSTQRVETDLRRAASESADRLDLSLRAFGRALRLVDSGGVRFLAVRNLGEHIEILLDTPLVHDPEGFAPTDDRRGWVTAPDLTTDRLRELADGEPAPEPCLVSLGTLADDTMLVDLETAGLLTIDGDNPEVESVIRHLAVELATSEIADHLQVLVVGHHILGEIGDAHPRIRHLDLDSAITELEATGNENQRAFEAVSSQMDRADLGPGIADLSCPTVLVSFEPLDDPVSRQRIEDVVLDRSRRVAAVVPSRDPARWNVEVHDGVLRLAPLGLVLDPFTLDATAAEAIDALIAEPHDDDIGEVLPARPTPSTVAVEALVDPPFDLEVRVLGHVEVTGAAQPFARHRHLEIAVYLAMHPDGVSDERLKTALWPDQAPKTATFNTAISTTRSHLGRDSNGDPHFSHFAAANRRYRLGARATSDYARFAARVEHARHADAEEAIADLRGALVLVRGQPFAEVHGFEWAWSEGFVANIETAVANAAHDLAQRYLELSEPDGAIWAAMQGLVGAPADEILYRDRMLACDLAGNPAGVQTVMRELQHAVEAVEPWDGIHPETAALYRRLRRRTSSA